MSDGINHGQKIIYCNQCGYPAGVCKCDPMAELNQAVSQFKEAKRRAWELLNKVLPIGKQVVTIRGCNAVEAKVFSYVADSPDYVYLQNDKNERGMFPVDSCRPVKTNAE